MDVHLALNDRRIKFQMEYDPTFQADVNTLGLLMDGKVPEKEVLSLMNYALREGDTAIDAGANIGFHTLVMAKLVGNTGMVEAFEPSKRNLDKLRANLRLNIVYNVRSYGLALWDCMKEMPWYETEADTGQASMIPEVSSGKLSDVCPNYMVSTTTLDTISSTPRLIKIDCEGAEEHVLRGGEKMLRRGVKFIVCELADYNLQRFGASQFSVRHFMADLGYDTWLLRPDGMLPIYIPFDIKLHTSMINLNVLFATQLAVTELWPDVDIDQYHGVR